MVHRPAKIRSMKGNGAAGVATVGAAGVEVIRDAAIETQAAVQPLLPYLDTLRWLFIAAALAWASATPWALCLTRWGPVANFFF